MHVPTHEESVNAWINIFLACMDQVWNSKRGATHGTSQVSDHDVNNKRYSNTPPKRYGSSLHQTFCGVEGYEPSDRAKINCDAWLQSGAMFRTSSYATMLGSTPDEMRIEMRKQYAKLR